MTNYSGCKERIRGGLYFLGVSHFYPINYLERKPTNCKYIVSIIFFYISRDLYNQNQQSFQKGKMLLCKPIIKN